VFRTTVNGDAYPEQVLGPVDDTLPGGSIGGERTSVGSGEGAPLSETLEGLVDGLNTMAPVEVGRLISVSDRILHTVQDDPANTIGEH